MRWRRAKDGGRRRSLPASPKPEALQVIEPSTPPEPRTFGEVLHRERRRKGLTADALGAAVGLDESVILGAESGATVLPAWSIGRLERTLETSLGHLLPRRPGPSGRRA